jgi:hypothetical protein
MASWGVDMFSRLGRFLFFLLILPRGRGADVRTDPVEATGGSAGTGIDRSCTCWRMRIWSNSGLRQPAARPRLQRRGSDSSGRRRSSDSRGRQRGSDSSGRATSGRENTPGRALASHQQHGREIRGLGMWFGREEGRQERNVFSLGGGIFL